MRSLTFAITPVVLLLLLLLLQLFHIPQIASVSASEHGRTSQSRSAFRAQRQPQRRRGNVAILVSTSRYWFNYRHQTNVLALYQFLKEHGGYDDDHLIVFVADDGSTAMNPRNPVKNQVYNTANAVQRRQHPSVYTPDTHIDFRGDDVTVENFINVLTGHDAEHLLFPESSLSSSLSSRLHYNDDDDDDSELPNLLVYLTGHGGDSFLKFRDAEEMTATQLAHALLPLVEVPQPSTTQQQRLQAVVPHFGQVLVIADTCQAFTLGNVILSLAVPNVTVIGSALLGESSYAHGSSAVLGLAVIEKYTHFMLQHVTQKALATTKSRSSTVSTAVTATTTSLWHDLTLHQALIQPYSKQLLGSNVAINSTHVPRTLTSSTTTTSGANQTMATFFVASHTRRRGGQQSLAEDSSAAAHQHQQEQHLIGRLIYRPEEGVGQRRRHGQWTLHGRGSTTSSNDTTPTRPYYSMVPTVNTLQQHHRASTDRFDGVEPHDGGFVAAVVALVVSVLVARRQWS